MIITVLTIGPDEVNIIELERDSQAWPRLPAKCVFLARGREVDTEAVYPSQYPHQPDMAANIMCAPGKRTPGNVHKHPLAGGAEGLLSQRPDIGRDGHCGVVTSGSVFFWSTLVNYFIQNFDHQADLSQNKTHKSETHSD